jgi:ribosomal protein S18 acetylase RimI-like enzyme
MEIQFSVTKADFRDIHTHLSLCKDTFVSPLGDRVDLDAYVSKIFCNADRLEAWDKSALIGLVAFYCGNAHGETAFVTSVSVLPEYQGSGIAVTLFDNCLSFVRKSGLLAIELEVMCHDVRAIRFYEKFGFNLIKHHGEKNRMRIEWNNQND